MTREQIEQLLESPYSREDWKNLIETIFDEVEFASSIEEIEVDETMASSARYLGRAMIEESSVDIGLYEVELKEKVVLERNRVGLRNLLRRDLAYHDGAFVVYHSPNSEEQEGKWRLSFVSETKYYDEDGEERDRKTEPKRFTYMLGKNEKVRTARDRFLVMLSKRGDVELKDIFEAFSVEKLSKSFFDEYKAYYERFCDNLITNDSYWISVFGENDKRVRDFVKKLLGRIVFLYFIEKKGWLGVDADKDWGEGDLNFLSNLFERSKENDLDEIFYSDVLTKLFFEALNTERDNDLISIIEGEEPYKVPFLNGGLFERELNTIGGINFEPKLFEDLFAFFARYNFTIYEDDPNDQTVAVDPEMLGHIFENLLEDNKDKGAFYTPKEIVHYMCQQSLIEYLAEGRDDREAIVRLVEMKEVEGIESSELDEIETKIDEVKICDPAIGSGAFPMGLLLEIFSIKQIIWNEKHGSLESFNAAETKTDIIQNSIYGVDIEKGAIDIARLRFWLSLVVDEAIPKPLPNLDYKIVEGNSLISLYEGEVVDIEPSRGRIYAASFDQAGQDSAQLLELHKTLIQEYQKHFKCVDKQEKDELSKSIRDIKIDILISSISNMIATKGTDNEPIRTKFKNNKRYVDACNLYTLTEKWRSMVAKLTQLKSEPNEKLSFFNWYIDFPDIMSPKLNPNPGFDIVIGNPPYGYRNVLTKNDKNYFRNVRKIIFSSGDSAELFTKISFDSLVRNKGLLTFIIPKKSLYGQAWESTRSDYWMNNKLAFILDTGKSFKNVLLEASAFCLQKKQPQLNTKVLLLSSDRINMKGEFAVRDLYTKHKTMQIYRAEFPAEMIEKIESKSYQSSVVEGVLGLAIGRRYYSEEETKTKLLKGVDIGKYQISGVRYLQNEDDLKVEDIAKFSCRKIIAQRLIAHINNPYPHLKITACYDDEGIVITNTLTSFTLINEINELFFLSYLNSKFFSWYAYNFVYARAIRGMDLYDFYLQQCLIPIVSLEEQRPFIQLVERVHEVKRNNEDSAELEYELDIRVYKLYDLDYSEVKIIDPEFTLTEEEYNNFE